MKLEYVLFWDEVAWVAGLTTYNLIVQGQTAARVIENLGHVAKLVMVETKEGKPFHPYLDELCPLKKFADTTQTKKLPQQLDRIKKTQKYVGVFEI
jgi:hypothetical protein